MPRQLYHAASRSVLYKLLSLGFRYPSLELFETFQNGSFLDELRNNISSLDHLNAVMAERSLFSRQKDLENISFADFEVIFVRTFDTDSPLPPCPLYEGMYLESPRTATMLEVSEFYRHFGLFMNRDEGKREMPDHICAELEFLHFLTFMESQAKDTELLKGYVLAQKDFLERHLTRWVPKFCDRLKSSDYVDFYIRLAQITSKTAACELTFVTSNLKPLE